jgi:hypothetical protein
VPFRRLRRRIAAFLKVNSSWFDLQESLLHEAPKASPNAEE